MSEIQQRPQPPTTTTTTSGGVTNVSSTSSTRSPSPPINSIVKHELVEQKAKSIQVSPIVPQQQQLPTPPVKTAASAAAASVKSTPAKVNMSGPICGNCQTQTTPLWRRDESGQVLCNACGLFLKLHGRPRPISLKTDTIKSRNRVKQSGTSSGKSTGPNTPELKSKEGKNGKKSPKPKKKSNNTGANSNENNTLTPLLPATANNTPSSFKSSNSSQTSLHNHHHLPNHVLQTHQVPLHYPSSTPTQFAPGLQRITSPLMLSTSSAVRNEPSDRKLTPIQAAAGALENMSNELGPSATFKKGTSNINGISLMNNRKNDSTSSSGSSSIFSSVAPSAPKLPALGSKIPSPVASRPYSRSSTPLQTLPPLHKMASSDSSLPSIHNISSFSHGTNNDNQKPFNQQQQQNNNHSPNNNNNQDGSNNNNNENNNNNNGGNSFTGNAHENHHNNNNNNNLHHYNHNNSYLRQQHHNHNNLCQHLHSILDQWTM
ncbi:GZF3 Transcriptional regulator GZF3 [Candida maltosa Xu316]